MNMIRRYVLYEKNRLPIIATRILDVLSGERMKNVAVEKTETLVECRNIGSVVSVLESRTVASKRGEQGQENATKELSLSQGEKEREEERLTIINL